MTQPPARHSIGWWPPADEWPEVRIAIIGSRHDEWRDPRFVRLYTYMVIDALPADAILISGRSDKGGVDVWAEERWRETRDPSHVLIFPPDFEHYGRPRAYHKRNVLIVSNADRVKGIWNGRSRGTHSTAMLAARMGKPVVLLRPES